MYLVAYVLSTKKEDPPQAFAETTMSAQDHLRGLYPLLATNEKGAQEEAKNSLSNICKMHGVKVSFSKFLKLEILDLPTTGVKL